MIAVKSWSRISRNSAHHRTCLAQPVEIPIKFCPEIINTGGIFPYDHFTRMSAGLQDKWTPGPVSPLPNPSYASSVNTFNSTQLYLIPSRSQVLTFVIRIPMTLTLTQDNPPPQFAVRPRLVRSNCEKHYPAQRLRRGTNRP